jgi:hypothetical protein
LLSKNINIKKYRIIILPVLYGCETLSLTPAEERRLRVFENRVLRRTFGPKKQEVTRDWRRLHNKEFNDLYSSPNIISAIKSRLRWAGRVARMGESRGAYRVLGRNMTERDHLEVTRVDGRIILKCIFKTWDEVGAWTGLVWLKIGTSGGACECGNEPSGSIKCEEFWTS